MLLKNGYGQYSLLRPNKGVMVIWLDMFVKCKKNIREYSHKIFFWTKAQLYR